MQLTAEMNIPGVAGATIPLTGVRIEARLFGVYQQVVVEQQFINCEKKAVEAIYTFPSPEGAAVYACEIVTSDAVLTARIEDKEKAQDFYDEAISNGHGAFLADENRPDIFTMHAGNLKPGQAALVRLRYMEKVDIQEHHLRLSYPTTIAPRYVTASGQANGLQAEIDGNVVNPLHVMNVPYGLTFKLLVDRGLGEAEISSPSHQLKVTCLPEGETKTTLAAEFNEMNRDLVVEACLPEELEPSGVMTPDPTADSAAPASIALVTFFPSFDAPPTAVSTRDILFILDCSGSMDGRSIAEAKNALKLCLRTLNLGDRLNIVRFGSDFEYMSPEPVIYSEPSLQQTLAYVDAIEADLGGTELYPLLEDVFSKAASGVRDIILMTDGQVSNESTIIDLTRQHAMCNRLFTFGIGSASSHYLVRGLALASGGAAEFISPGERIEEKVLRMFTRLDQPTATDVKVDWGQGCRSLQAPTETPTLFVGDCFQVLARLEGELPDTVTLSCRINQEEHVWTVRLCADPSFEVAQGIAAQWARDHIRELIGNLESFDYVGWERQTPEQHRSRKQVTEISTRYGVLSPFTSFIAVEHRSIAERNDGRPELRRVPIQLAKGWHGLPDLSKLLYASNVVMSEDAYVACDCPEKSFSSYKNSNSNLEFLDIPAFLRRQASDEESQSRGETKIDLLVALLMLQQADGHFEWDPDLVKKVLIALESIPNLDVMENMLARSSFPAEAKVTGRVRQTIFILVILSCGFQNQKPLWERAAKKAEKWICKTLRINNHLLSQDLSELVASVNKA